MKRCLLAFALLGLSGPWLHGQATDLVDMKDLLGRGVYFETEETIYMGIQRCVSVGDVNGDGLSDIGFSRWMKDPVEDLKVYLIFGSPEWVGRDVVRPELPGSIHYVVTPSRSYVVPVGDLNRDGYSEFAFTGDRSPGEEPRDAVFIVHGKPEFTDSGEIADEVGSRIPGSMIFTTRPETEQAGFNGNCASVDINGDGKLDLGVGCVLGNSGATDKGFVHVLLDAGDLGPRVDLADVGDSLPGFTLHTPGLLRALSDAGDFDGDGIHDLLVADGRWDSSQNGSVYLFFGRPDPVGHYDLQELSELEDRVIRFFMPGRYYLSFAQDDQAAGVGDVDGDGFDDILLGESYYGFNLEENIEGGAHLVYGTNRRGLGPDPLAVLRTTAFRGLGAGFKRDEFGLKVGAPGDLTGDGIPEILIGAPDRSERLDREGEAYLIFGRRDFGPEVRLADGFDGIRIRGNTNLGELGFYFGPAGDFNGDGHPDLLVGEPHLSFAAEGTSKAIVIFGSGSEKPPMTVISVEPRSGFLRGGTRVRIRGSGFEPGTRVHFGASEAIVLSVAPLEIEATSPPGTVLGESAVAVTVGGTMRFAPVSFEYVEDRPDIDLASPGRWGLRLDGVPGFAIGSGLDFADLDDDGQDDLLVGSDLGRDWLVTVVRGGKGLPPVMEAFTPDPGVKSLIYKRGTEDRISTEVRVRNIGDVNGDGIDDAGAAAYYESGYLLFGRRSLASELDLDEEVGAGRAVRLLFDRTVSKVDFAALGDLTADGIDDLAIALSSDSVLFVAGSEDWPKVLDLGADTGGQIVSRLTGSGGSYALRIAQVGDANGDGRPELLVTGNAPSFVYLLHLRPLLAMPANALIDDHVFAGGGVPFEWEGQGAGIMSISAAGDVNADGLADFLIGNERARVAVSYEGITYLVHGREQFPEKITFPADMSPIDIEGVVRVGGGGLKQSGMSVAPAGDYNGDGHPDFTIVAATLELFNPLRLHVVLGSPDLPPVLEIGNLGRRGFELRGLHSYAYMQNRIAAPGDLNADGAPDFAFSEFGQPDGARPAGAVHVVFGIPPRVSFVRGDTNHDGGVDITDAISTLGFLFLGQRAPACEDAADADDRGTLEITDAVYILNYLFGGGPEPSPPHNAAGEDPTEDALGCRGF